MDPDYFTKTERLKTFLKLYGKIAMYGFAVVISIITIAVIAHWETDTESGPNIVANDQLGEVLAESDSELDTGGVTFGIPTSFTADAQFDTNITIAQNTNLDGDVYYKGQLVDLSLLSEDGFQIGGSDLAQILEEGAGISIEGDDILTITNTGVLSFNGETGNVEIDVPSLSEVEDLLKKQTLFKNFQVPGYSPITPSSNTDTFTFIPGTGVTLTPDSVTKSITISSSTALSAINNIYGTANQIIVNQSGQDVTLSLPQSIHVGATVTFAGIQLLDLSNIGNMLLLGGDGHISTLNDADLVLGSSDTGNIQLISKGSTALIIDGPDLTASGALSGITDLTASGTIKFTSLGNGVVQALGYTLSSGPVDLSSDTYVTNALKSKHGGTGTDKAPIDGQVLIGSGLTGEYEPRSISTGSGISISRGPYSLSISNTGVTTIRGGVRHILVNGSYVGSGMTGDITLTLPQIIDTSASPEFVSLKLTSDENLLTFDDGSGNPSYIKLASLTGSRTYTFPDSSGSVCLTSGNCTGVGGGLVGLGTANFIPKYHNAGTLTPSILYDNGSTLGIGTTAPLEGTVLDVNGSLRIGVAGGQYDILNTTAAAGDPGSTLFWGSRVLCDSTGSCSGTDGGVFSSGTSKYLAVFAANGNSLANSLIYDTGTSVGVGTTSPSGYFSISGGAGTSALAVNQTDSLKNIIDASSQGTSKMVLTSVGDLDLVSGVYKSQGQSGATVSGYSCVITTGGIVTGSGDCPVDPAADLWDSQTSGIFAKDATKNFILGGTTVNNAKFAVLNMNSGDPTIWLRESATKTLSITSSGTIKTINDSDITLESGKDIVLSPGTGDIVIDGKIVTPESTDLVIEPEGSVSIRPHGQLAMNVSTSGVGINTALSQGVLTIKEISSYGTPGDDGGGEGGSVDGNLILDPADSDFSSDTGHWNLGSGWSISGGTLNFTGGTVSITLENQYMGFYVQPGVTYTIKFDLIETTSPGAFGVQLGNVQNSFIWADMPPYDYGTKTVTLTPTAAGNLFIYANNGWQGKIDNVRVTSAAIQPPTPTPVPPVESGPGIVIVNSDGSDSPMEIRGGGSGLFNSFVGYLVGGVNGSGEKNSGFGAQALQNLVSGLENSAFGFQSLMTNEEGQYNSAFGSQTLRLATGSFNSAFGSSALSKATTGESNSAFGANSLLNITTGSYNTGIGVGSLFTNTTGASNSAIGYFALNKSTISSHNTAFGAGALTSATTGSNNTALGAYALRMNLTGANNVALGYQAMNSYTAGNGTAIGYQAMFNNKTGASVTAVGYQALYNATGASNTALGASALRAVTSGASNIGLGASAGYGITTGSYNINIGEGTSYSNTAGSNNTVIGYNALMWGTSGSNNTSIGYQAGYRLDGGVGNIFIGANAGPSGFSTFSNQLYIDNTAGNPLIWGDFSANKVGINLATPTSANNTFSVAGSMCVTATGVCASNTAGTIYTTNTVVTGADVAENYVSAQILKPGDIVSMADNGNSQAIVKADGGLNRTLLGVVSSAPGVTINSEAKTDSVHKYVYPVALTGRVPTKVSTENGSISAGDPLTIGSTPGVAVKATNSGYIIGRALEPYSSSGVATIIVYANAGWYAPMIVNAQGNITSDDLPVLANPISGANSSVDDVLGIADQKDGMDQLLARTALLEEAVRKLEEQSAFVTEILESQKKHTASSGAQLFSTFKEVSIEKASVSASLSVGSLIMNADTSSVSSYDKPLKLQVGSSQNVEIFNGAITMSEQGDVITKGTITASKIRIESENEESRSIGEGKILEGEKSVTITTTAVTDKSNIFITPKTLFPGILAVTEQKDKESFKVEIENSAPKDIIFNWWIVN